MVSNEVCCGLIEEVVLTVSDGLFLETVLINISIGMVDDEIPRLTLNKGLTVWVGTYTRMVMI